MKATGIVRRIDDLGRVVIPKEIRRTMRIREGDPLEIYTERDGSVILKKYSPIGELNRFAGEYAESAHNILGESTLVTDTDQVVAVSGISRKEYMEKHLSSELEALIREKQPRLFRESQEALPITNDEEDTGTYGSQIIVPIVFQGDAIGSVVVLTREKDHLLGDIELRTAEVGANFLAKQMEN